MTSSAVSAHKVSAAVTVLEIENARASARVSLFGGQVLAFCPRKDGRERLYLSRLARLDGSKSIRGGVPVCWPWFGAHREDASLPAHGFIRTRQWRLLDCSDSEGQTELLLQAEQSEGPGFAGTAEVQLHLLVGDSLEISLHTRNTGSSSFPLSAALHTYFAVDDIQTVRLEGISGEYSDKTQNWQQFQTPSPYGFSAETDRIHLQACPAVKIRTGEHCTGVQSRGHDSLVVWNPWDACARNFADMEAADYRRMLCVETALTQGFVLAPGSTHILTQRID